MPDATYHDIMRDVVAEAVAEVQAELKVLVEEVWPQLVELQPRAARKAWYMQIDMNAVRDVSELFWQKITDDAKRIMADEERGMEVPNPLAMATGAYEQQAFTQDRAYRAETQPFGPIATRDADYALGIGTPLPLGRV